MLFMVILYGGEQTWRSLTQAQIDAVGDTHRRLQAQLHESEELVDHTELSASDSGARVLLPTGSEPQVHDGPRRDGGLFAGGYYLLDCADLNRATEIAGQFGEAAFAPIEVREVVRQTSWDERRPDGGS